MYAYTAAIVSRSTGFGCMQSLISCANFGEKAPAAFGRAPPATNAGTSVKQTPPNGTWPSKELIEIDDVIGIAYVSIIMIKEQ